MKTILRTYFIDIKTTHNIEDFSYITIVDMKSLLWLGIHVERLQYIFLLSGFSWMDCIGVLGRIMGKQYSNTCAILCYYFGLCVCVSRDSFTVHPTNLIMYGISQKLGLSTTRVSK